MQIQEERLVVDYSALVDIINKERNRPVLLHLMKNHDCWMHGIDYSLLLRQAQLGTMTEAEIESALSELEIKLVFNFSLALAVAVAQLMAVPAHTGMYYHYGVSVVMADSLNGPILLTRRDCRPYAGVKLLYVDRLTAHVHEITDYD